MKEHKSLEFKETITNTFLKTVSAYANYGGGDIVFGIDDDGNKKGLEDPRKACLDIENKINDSITPQPDYSLQVQETDKTVRLTVRSGANKPFLYKSKAYKRNDTETIEVDRAEFKRLILEGENLSFEQLPSQKQELTFRIMEDKLRESAGIENFNKDVLKTLNLYSDKEGYSNAAAVLADENDFPGIDLAKFGETINIIEKRATIDHMSALAVYGKAIEMFRDYYQYEEISGSVRTNVERIPESAFREAVANALIHRTWDVSGQIRIFMFDDRVEILSPGGLPNGITESEYLSGRLSVLRNPILGNVFYRLKLVEIFGTGVLRIRQTYADSIKKPVFEVSDNLIKVILPVTETDLNLTEDEEEIYTALSKTIAKPISEIVTAVSFGKSKTAALLKSMEKRGLVTIEGKGRGTKYRA